MSTLVARIVPAAEAAAFGLAETSLAVLLVAALPISAVIFVAQTL